MAIAWATYEADGVIAGVAHVANAFPLVFFLVRAFGELSLASSTGASVRSVCDGNVGLGGRLIHFNLETT